MPYDYFPDASDLEYQFSLNYSYIAPISEIDPVELDRLIDEGYVRIDQRNDLAVLTRKGWEWCRYEHSRNRTEGDSFLGTVPLYMSRDDLVRRLNWPEGEVERVADTWFAAAKNSIGFFDYNHVAYIVKRRDVLFTPTCVYPRPIEIEPVIGRPGGWIYVPDARAAFQQHDIEIELAVAEPGQRLDGTDDPDSDGDIGGRRREYTSWGAVYGPRGHIAYIELDDDGIPHMPWATAESILRDHAGVETLTLEMVRSLRPDDDYHRRDRL